MGPPCKKELAMSGRLFGALVALVAIGWIAAAVSAAEPQLHKGTVVSAGGNKLVMKDTAGKEQSFTVDEVTKITVNGKPGRLEDLQETMPIQVTTDEKGKTLAIATVDKDKGGHKKGGVLVALATH
jgi:hypothetical protein